MRSNAFNIGTCSVDLANLVESVRYELEVMSVECGHLSDVFPEVYKIVNFGEELQMRLTEGTATVSDEESIEWDEAKILLLCVQGAYKQIMSSCTDSIRFMDLAQLLRNVTQNVNISKVNVFFISNFTVLMSFTGKAV